MKNRQGTWVFRNTAKNGVKYTSMEDWRDYFNDQMAVCAEKALADTATPEDKIKYKAKMETYKNLSNELTNWIIDQPEQDPKDPKDTKLYE